MRNEKQTTLPGAEDSARSSQFLADDCAGLQIKEIVKTQIAHKKTLGDAVNAVHGVQGALFQLQQCFTVGDCYEKLTVKARHAIDEIDAILSEKVQQLDRAGKL